MVETGLVSDPNRHQAWDDHGLGFSRSGVLLSHSRQNGVPPQFREGVASLTGARFPCCINNSLSLSLRSLVNHEFIF